MCNKGCGSSNFIQDHNEQGSSQGNRCSNHNATNYNIRRCTAIASRKLYKKEGHTYVKCKGKDIESDD